MKFMKAVQIHSYKNPSDLTPREVPIPQVNSGDVLVKIQFAGVNPSDLANIQGAFPDHTILPRIIGRDFVGKVVEGAPELIGKTVMGSGGDIGFNRDGTFAEYMAIPKNGVIEVPKGLDLTHAATLGVPFLAALASLNSFTNNLKGKTLLLIGGTGAVGSAANVIARKRGATVVRTVRHPSEVKDLSADLQGGVFMDLSQNGDIQAQTKMMLQGKGFDFIINMVGGATFEPALNSLNVYGQMACIATPGQPRVELSLLDFYRKNLSLFGLNTVLDDTVASADKLRKLFSEFEADISALACLGQTEVMPFNDAKNILEKALAKELRKPVLQMSEN